MAKKTKSTYNPRQVEKNYRKYGHKDAFSNNQLAKKHKYHMAKYAGERAAKERSVTRKRKTPQVKRGFVSATLDTLASPLSAVATPVYNKLKGKKTNVFMDIWRGGTAGLPGSGRANQMKTFSDVFDAGQDYMHRHGRTTRTDEMLVRMGKATYAPRPTAGNSSNKYGVPVIGADGTYESLKNTSSGKTGLAAMFDPYQVTRGASGFALDMALDPLNFISKPASVVGKFVKGSGASLSRLKQIGRGLEGVERVAKSTDESGHVVRTVIKPGESVDDVLEGFDNAASTVQVKKTKDVVKHLYTERDARKRTELLSGVSEDGVYQRLRKNQAYEIYDNDALKTIARDTSDTFRSTYLHIPTPKEEIDIAMGLKNKPFSHMRSLYLNKKVAMDQAIRKAGDLSGVAPMYNELAQKLRTSRIGRTFSNINKTEADIRHNYDAIENYATLYAVKGKQGLADANIDILTKADKFIEQWNSLSPEQQLRVRSAIENGDLKRANSFFTFQEKTGNKLDNVDVDKTVQGIQDQVKLFQIDKQHAENVLRVLEEQGQRKFTPAQYMFYKVNGKMPDLSTKDKDVIDIYNLMLLDSKYQDLDVSKTFLNAYNNVMDMHAESVMGRLDTNVRKGVSTFTKGSNFTALGLARSRLENGTADVATAFDEFIRTVGAEDAYYFLRDNAVFGNDLKTRLAYGIDRPIERLERRSDPRLVSNVFGKSNLRELKRQSNLFPKSNIKKLERSAVPKSDVSDIWNFNGKNSKNTFNKKSRNIKYLHSKDNMLLYKAQQYVNPSVIEYAKQKAANSNVNPLLKRLLREFDMGDGKYSMGYGFDVDAEPLSPEDIYTIKRLGGDDVAFFDKYSDGSIDVGTQDTEEFIIRLLNDSDSSMRLTKESFLPDYNVVKAPSLARADVPSTSYYPRSRPLRNSSALNNYNAARYAGGAMDNGYNITRPPTLSRNMTDDIYVNPVTSHALDMLKTRGANDGDFLATAFNAVKDTFIKATVAGDTSRDGLKEAGNIVSIVDDKLAEASRSGKKFTLNDVLLNLKDETRKGIVDAYIDTAQGHRDLIGRVSGNSLFDKYKSWRQADEKALREARNTVAYSEKQSTFRDLLSPADNEFLDSIGMMESIINPTFKANSFSQSLEDVGDAIDKLRFYEEQYDKFRKSAEAFEGGTQGTMYDLVRGFTNEMNRIGVEEVRAGELATEQFKKYKDVYFPHIMTDEAKKINNARGLEFESNGAFSDAFSRGGNYASHRISGLTVDEMNASKGYEYFKTNLVDVYLERALQSNRLIYADSSTNFLFDKFSKEVAPLVEGVTKLSSGVDQNHTLAIPFNALDRIINKTAGRSISKAAYQYAKNAAKTFEANYSSRQAVETIRADIREVRAALKEHTDFINKYKPLFDDKAYPRYNEYLNARHSYDEAREAEKLGYGSHELTEARGELFQKYADDKESFFMQQDKENYALYNKAIKEVGDMRDTLNGLFDDLKKSRLEYNKNLNLMKQNGYTNLAGDMTHDEIVEAYKNIWMREHGNEMFRERKNSVVDSIFGKADDKDRKIAMRRQCYATNIPVQTLTDEQAEAIRALYNKPEDFYKDICQFDNDVLDKVNIMSRSQELAGTHAILKAYDNFILQYKRLNTLVDWSFHEQNGLSNAFQSFMGTSAAAFNPSKLKRAYNILKANPEDATKIVELGGKEYTYRQLYEYMKQFGVVDESFTRFEMLGGNTDRVINNIRQSPAIKNVFKDAVYPWNIDEDATKFEKAMSYNPMSWYMQWSGNVGSNLETTQRANLFMNALDEGQSLSDAVRTVNKYMFDYSDLTKFEKDWLKRAIPFYTFMRKNIPIELETLLTKPQKFSAIAYLEQELNNEQEGSIHPYWRNEWRQNYFQIPGLGDGQWGIDPKLPYEQLDRLDFHKMSNGWEPKALGRLLGSTNPFIKAPTELLTGVNQYVDAPIDEDQDGMDINDYIKYGMGMTIPTKIASEVIGYNKEENDDKRLNNQVKDITSHLAFPIGHIYDMAEFKNMIEATNYKTGEKFNYASYVTQDEVEDLYKNTYLKWAQEEHDRKELQYSRAYDSYKKSKYYRQEGRPSFDEALEKWHVKKSYEQYVEDCKASGFTPRSKKDWKKYNNYKYVEE